MVDFLRTPQFLMVPPGVQFLFAPGGAGYIFCLLYRSGVHFSLYLGIFLFCIGGRGGWGTIVSSHRYTYLSGILAKDSWPRVYGKLFA
jgi:hypothetical protein